MQLAQDAKRQRTPGIQSNHSSSCSGRQPAGVHGMATDTDAGLRPGAEEATGYKDVVLRIEFARSGEVKALSYLMMATLLAGIAVTVYIKDNLITGCVCLLISSLLWALYAYRGTWLLLRQLRWDHRRHRTYLVRLAELSCIILNFACWTFSSSERRLEENLEMNASMDAEAVDTSKVAAAVPTPKADENHQAAASIQAPPYQAEPVLAGATIAAIAQAATAKAMSTDEQLYIDAPWWEYLAPFAWLWVPFQCLVGINIGLLAASVKSNKAYDQCIQWFLECRNASATSFIFHIVMLVAEVLNIYLSVEVRIRGVTLLYIVANDIVQTFYVPKVEVPGKGEEHCRYSLDSILGVWSTQAGHHELHLKLLRVTLTVRITYVHTYGMLQVIFMALVCTLAWLFIPRSTHSSMPIMQATLQVLREEESDAKVMIAWSWKMCVICFRGTASIKAACVDLKAMLKPYYNREAWMSESKLARLAAVHHGFQWSWRHRGFNCRVLDWVVSYRKKHPHGKLLVTGHSLGGAHATLCTLDIIHELRGSLPPHHISCYTYGAPRVGNHAFAAMYDKVVYETWNVVNCNDMVPLTPKCVGWFVYKHPGHKVIVKRRGDLIVRPTFMENAVARLPCSRSVRHHLLGSYLRSMMAVLRAQTRGKHVEGGVRGLLHLTMYRLPEVDAVLADVVEEVQAVALAAVEAVQMVEKRSLAAAAAKTSSSGSAVYHSLAKYGSIRLLMDQESRKSLHNSVQQQATSSTAVSSVTVSRPPAVSATDPVVAENAGCSGAATVGITGEPLSAGLPAASGESFILKSIVRPRAVLHGLARRLNMGMELMGVETGLLDDDDPVPATASQALAASTSHTGSALSSMPTVSPNEMMAFQRALVAQHEAHEVYKRNKEVRRQERRALAKLHAYQRSKAGKDHSVNSRHSAAAPTASTGGMGASLAPQPEAATLLRQVDSNTHASGHVAQATYYHMAHQLAAAGDDRKISARRRLHAKRQAAREPAADPPHLGLLGFQGGN
uniref:LPS1p n=1 Tax=Chlamydomonas reinhardtii TaxID=3055 RepID=D5LAW3_CHLRE|nr:LPS1p [Chlamydomonas reinhardtii]